MRPILIPVAHISQAYQDVPGLGGYVRGARHGRNVKVAGLAGGVLARGTLSAQQEGHPHPSAILNLATDFITVMGASSGPHAGTTKIAGDGCPGTASRRLPTCSPSRNPTM